MNLSDLPTPKLPNRMPWHTDEYYALMLKAYLKKTDWRPSSFNLDMEAREKLRELGQNEDEVCNEN